MAKKTPTIRDTKLFWFDSDENKDVFACDIVEDWQTWQGWLDREKVFRFHSPDGLSCSLRKVGRAHFGDRENKRMVWYAHKRIAGKLYRKYLGKNENVDYQKLRQAVHWLYQKKLTT